MKVDATLEIELEGVASDELEALLEIMASLKAKVLEKKVSASPRREPRRILVRDMKLVSQDSEPVVEAPQRRSVATLGRRDVYAYPQNKICG